jgi:hypothetical protein
MMIEDFNETTDRPFLTAKIQPYFRSIFTDIALRSHATKKEQIAD